MRKIIRSVFGQSSAGAQKKPEAIISPTILNGAYLELNLDTGRLKFNLRGHFTHNPHFANKQREHAENGFAALQLVARPVEFREDHCVYAIKKEVLTVVDGAVMGIQHARVYQDRYRKDQVDYIFDHLLMAAEAADFETKFIDNPRAHANYPEDKRHDLTAQKVLVPAAE